MHSEVSENYLLKLETDTKSYAKVTDITWSVFDVLCEH